MSKNYFARTGLTRGAFASQPCAAPAQAGRLCKLRNRLESVCTAQRGRYFAIRTVDELCAVQVSVLIVGYGLEDSSTAFGRDLPTASLACGSADCCVAAVGIDGCRPSLSSGMPGLPAQERDLPQSVGIASRAVRGLARRRALRLAQRQRGLETTGLVLVGDVGDGTPAAKFT